MLSPSCERTSDATSEARHQAPTPPGGSVHGQWSPGVLCLKGEAMLRLILSVLFLFASYSLSTGDGGSGWDPLGRDLSVNLDPDGVLPYNLLLCLGLEVVPRTGIEPVTP